MLLTLIKPAETSHEKLWRKQSYSWAPFTDETSIRLDYYQRLTLEGWFTNLEQTPLNRSQRLPAQYKRLIDRIKQK